MKKIHSYLMAFFVLAILGNQNAKAQCISPNYAASGTASTTLGQLVQVYSGRDANGIHGYYINVFLHAGYQYQFKQYVWSGCCGQVANTGYYATITDSANNVLQSGVSSTYFNFSTKVSRTIRVHISHTPTCASSTQSTAWIFYLDVTTTARCPHSYRDLDGDGFGSPLDSLVYDACPTPTAGYVANNTDCDDNNPNAHMVETWYLDADHDGYGDINDLGTSSCGAPTPNHVLNHTDCDDSNAIAHSSATWYEDADGDGFGSAADIGTVYCGDPNLRLNTAGFVLTNMDCDDTNPMIGPASPEIYGNTIDENCDGETEMNENALHFLGTSFVGVAHSNSINLGHEFTIEAMINPGNTTNKTIVDKGDYDFCFQVFNSNLGYYNRQTTTWYQSTLPIVANQWQHVALVHYANDSIVFYINGNYAGSAINTGFAQDNGWLRIGQQSPTTCACNNFVGAMDEFRLWNTPRTSQQINDNMSKSLCGGEPYLGAYYKFNTGVAGGSNTSISTIIDHSGNGNAGGLVGFNMNGLTGNFILGDTMLVSSATTNSVASNDTICTGDMLTLSGAGGVNYIWSDFVTNGVPFLPTGTATYHMIGLDANGCSNYDSTTVVVQNCQATQTINFPAIPVKYFGDADFTLNAAATSGLPVTYVSSDPLVANVSADVVTIVGVGTTTIIASQAGNASFYAAADEQQVLTVLSPIGLTSLSQTNGIIVYPNPAHDVLTVKLPKAYLGANVKIVSLLGAVMYDKTEGEENISIQNFAAGIYNVVVTTADKVEVKKIMIQ